MEFVFNNFTTNRKNDGGFFKKIIEIAAKETGLESKRFELSVNLVGEGRIKSLNKRYRSRNRVTDVLSFPLQERIGAKTKSGDIINLGDIFICFSEAKKRAIREGVDLDYKLAFLVVHGLLHLLGYDHEKSAKEKDEMFALQNKIVSKIGF